MIIKDKGDLTEKMQKSSVEQKKSVILPSDNIAVCAFVLTQQILVRYCCVVCL